MLEEKKRYELLQQEAANTAQELTDLRGLVFHQQENMYFDNKPDDQISFPYHTQNRIVAFGGHETWSREMRPKLPDVRFVDRTMGPNADMIRRADVVWIQTNAISHGYYYKIIDEVRKYDVRVRYFSYASAQKCAEQIVADEKTMNKLNKTPMSGSNWTGHGCFLLSDKLSASHRMVGMLRIGRQAFSRLPSQRLGESADK